MTDRPGRLVQSVLGGTCAAVYEVSHWSCCPDCCFYRYRGVSSTGMSFRPSTYSSTGGGYNDRDDDRYGGSYGGSRGGRDDYDSYGGGSRDGDRYRDDDRSGRDKDRYKDDGYGGDRDRNIDDYSTKGSFNDKYDSGATSDRDRDRGYDDDDRYSSRCNMAPISLCFSCLVFSIQFGSNSPYGELLFCVKIFSYTL